MIQRYDYHYDSGLDADTLQPDNDGDWVLYNDHLAELAEKDKEIKDKDALLYSYKGANKVLSQMLDEKKR